MDYIDGARYMASTYGWSEIQHNTESAVVGFVRDCERINVYYTTWTVGTCIDHPRQGKTQMFRKNVQPSDLERIFENPRVHTGKGYYRRVSHGAPEPSLERLYWTGVVSDGLMDDFNPGTTPLVALGDGYFAKTSDGEPYWGGNLPIQFTNKLRGRQRNLPKVDFVAFGPGDTYFVQFADGKSQWNGASHDFDEKVQNASSGIHFVAFGPDDGYYILFDDGSSSWCNLPLGLHNKLNGRQKSLPGVDRLNMGPNGEWFVRFKDGAWRSNGLPDFCDEEVDDLHEQGHEVVDILFGHDYTWLITYS